jgi:hypothetical protein
MIRRHKFKPQTRPPALKVDGAAGRSFTVFTVARLGSRQNAGFEGSQQATPHYAQPCQTFPDQPWSLNRPQVGMERHTSPPLGAQGMRVNGAANGSFRRCSADFFVPDGMQSASERMHGWVRSQGDLESVPGKQETPASLPGTHVCASSHCNPRSILCALSTACLCIQRSMRWSRS